MALTDAVGHLIRFEILPGQTHDLKAVPELLDDLTCGTLIGDKAFDADWVLDPETQVSSQRFRLPREIPRVMLPGGVNFMTRWRGREFGRDQVPRPQYSHSSEIAHVGLSEDEMAGLGDALANVLSEATRSTTVIIPMGGFSSEDCPGGLLENKPGRAAFAESLMAQANNRLRVVRTDDHINDFAVAELAVGILRELIDEHQAGRVT